MINVQGVERFIKKDYLLKIIQEWIRFMSECHFCKKNAETKRGTIYVRVLLDNKWGNVGCCLSCWKERYE